MLLELAVGDAYGAGFEYAKPEVLATRKNDLSQYYTHSLPGFLPAGSYTDDTQMSIAIAELLVEKAKWIPENIAEQFVRVFKRDPRQGYASQFYQFLTEVCTGKDFLERIKPNSDKSGAAMRAAPLGVLPSVALVKEYAQIQAGVTHSTPGGITSACAAALMSHYFLYDLGQKEYLTEFVREHVPGEWTLPWQGKVGVKGMMSVAAAITAVTSEDSLSAILRRCVAFGGDTDTVAAMAMAAASCSREVHSDLPLTLIDNLENGAFGKNFLIKLDNRLLTLFPQKTMTTQGDALW